MIDRQLKVNEPPKLIEKDTTNAGIRLFIICLLINTINTKPLDAWPNLLHTTMINDMKYDTKMHHKSTNTQVNTHLN